MSERNTKLVNQIFENARFIRELGIELTSFGEGWCETRIRVTPTLEQQHGLVHAGVLMTLADHTCGGAAATMAPEGQDVITVENKVSFLRRRPDKYFSVAPMFCEREGDWFLWKRRWRQSKEETMQSWQRRPAPWHLFR